MPSQPRNSLATGALTRRMQRELTLGRRAKEPSPYKPTQRTKKLPLGDEATPLKDTLMGGAAFEFRIFLN